MPSFTVSGSLINRLQKVEGQGQKGPWAKQEFVIETLDKEFPKKIIFCLWNDKIDFLKGFKKNDVICVSFGIESKEHNGRWFSENRAFKIESGDTLTPKEPAKPQHQKASTRVEKQVYDEENYDDDSYSFPL